MNVLCVTMAEESKQIILHVFPQALKNGSSFCVSPLITLLTENELLMKESKMVKKNSTDICAIVLFVLVVCSDGNTLW